MKHHYCSGSCHGQPGEGEVETGKKTCDTQGCSMEGKPFINCECDNPVSHTASQHGSERHHRHDQIQN